MNKDNVFTVTAKEFASIYGVLEKNAYRALEEAATTLYQRDIKTFDGKHRTRFRWVYFVKYHEDEGKVSLGFSPCVSPYLTLLHKRFTSYKISQISNLKKTYSIRLLEFLAQFKKTGKVVVDIETFKIRLGIEQDYKRFFDLKRWVIEPAVSELIEKSGFSITWKALKGNSGKAIKQLEFRFKEKSEKQIETASETVEIEVIEV
jgi:plasmid replication initiation protein